MATMYRTSPIVDTLDCSVRFWRDSAETLIVGGDVFLRMRSGTLVPQSGEWRYTQAEADAAAIPKLTAYAVSIQQAIDTLTKRPALAEADALVPSAGAAQAAVAT